MNIELGTWVQKKEFRKEEMDPDHRQMNRKYVSLEVECYCYEIADEEHQEEIFEKFQEIKDAMTEEIKRLADLKNIEIKIK